MRPATKQSTFDAMTPAEYDAWYDSGRGRWIGSIEYEPITRMLQPQSGDHLLDVGCGSGWFTRRLARQPAVQVTAVDVDPSALAFAREHDPTTCYLRADARALPFEACSFERVLCMTALGFVPDWPQALREIVRVTGTRFVLGLLHRHSALWVQKGRAGGAGAYRGTHWHTRQETLRVLGDLPVTHVQFRSAISLPSGSWPARMLEACAPGCIPFGSVLMVAGDKASAGARSL
jgi:SAM-dependent methyltransferase